jgi:hypothetical protein
MRWLTLEAVSDDYDNKPGFALHGAKRYEGFMADRTGDMLAHDIVEHQNGLRAIGPVWDELQAMGGVWHTRGRWGNIGTGNHSPQVNVASDIVNMAREVACRSFRDFDAMGPRPKATHLHVYDDDFQEILKIAAKDIPGELDDLSLDVDQYLAEALHHMRTGYRKAERRFGDRFASANQYGAIKREAERMARYIDYEGQLFRLGWGNGECVISEIWEFEQ